MATFEQENEMRASLSQNLNVLSEISVDSLVKKEELGSSLNFEEGLPYFSRILKLFNGLKNSNLDGASHTALNQMNNQATQALALFKEVREFSIEKYPQNTKSQRDSLLNKIRDSYDDFYKTLTPHIAYSIRKGTDFEALEQQARETLDDLNKIKKSIVDEQIKAQKNSEAILDSMRKAAAEAGVSQHSIYFKEEADAHQKLANTWLKASYIMASITILFAIVATAIYFIQISDLNLHQSIQLAVTKILIFSVLYYATIWCSKNYRSHLHNYITNKHRQNSLSTFQAFVKATEDPATKDAVLIRATESIFSIGNSGFVSGESESDGSSHILEIIRNGVKSNNG